MERRCRQDGQIEEGVWRELADMEEGMERRRRDEGRIAIEGRAIELMEV